MTFSLLCDKIEYIFYFEDLNNFSDSSHLSGIRGDIIQTIGHSFFITKLIKNNQTLLKIIEGFIVIFKVFIKDPNITKHRCKSEGIVHISVYPGNIFIDFNGF